MYYVVFLTTWADMLAKPNEARGSASVGASLRR
jgi:hypothetical protein